MSEKMELKSCPFCRATPHRGPTRMITDQIHGEKIFRYKIWCPHGCATIDRPNEAMTIEDWNALASSPEQESVTTEHDGERTREEAEQEIVLLADRIVVLMREKKELHNFVGWVDSWVSNPVSSYSVAALDGLFGMTRDKIAALSGENSK